MVDKIEYKVPDDADAIYDLFGIKTKYVYELLFENGIPKYSVKFTDKSLFQLNELWPNGIKI